MAMQDIVPRDRTWATADSTIAKWREQLRKGSLDLAILLAVRDRERYGLEILRFLARRADLEVGAGTLYPILARLTEAGSLSARWEAEESAHPRKYYSLTESGRIVLDAMVAHWRLFCGRIDHLIDDGEEEPHEAR